MDIAPSVVGFSEDFEFDKDAPRVDSYDEFDDEDERRLLDASPHGIIGRQRITPLSGSSAAAASKLAEGRKIFNVSISCKRILVLWMDPLI